MHIFDLIDIYSQFVPYIIINDIAPFNQIVRLAQTCTKLNQYFHAIRPYSLLCRYQTKKVNMAIFMDPNYLYKTQYEKQLFQKIYATNIKNIKLDQAVLYNHIVIIDLFIYCKNYIIDDCILYNSMMESAAYYAIKINNIIILDKLLLLGHKFNKNINVNKAASKGYIEILDWFYDNSIKNPSQVSFCYTYEAINKAAKKGHVSVLNWFLKLHLKDCKYDLLYTSEAIDQASRYHRIEVLNWFLKQNFLLNIPLLYTPNSLNTYNEKNIFKNHRINYQLTLNWWLNSGLELKYLNHTVDFAAHDSNLKVLKWFLKIHLKHGYPFRHSANAVESVAKNLNIRILDWFFEIYYKYNIPFLYNADVIDYASRKAHIDILNWFSNHSNEKWLVDKYFPTPAPIPFKYTSAAFSFDEYADKAYVLRWWASKIKEDAMSLLVVSNN